MVAVGSTCAAAWPRRRAATLAVMTFNGPKGERVKCHDPGSDRNKSIPDDTKQWTQVYPVYESDSPNQGSHGRYNPEKGIKDGRSTDQG